MGAAENLAIHVRWSDDNDRHDLSNYHAYMHDDIEVYHLDGSTVSGIEAVAKNMADSIEKDARAACDRRGALRDRRPRRVPLAGQRHSEGVCRRGERAVADRDRGKWPTAVPNRPP